LATANAHEGVVSRVISGEPEPVVVAPVEEEVVEAKEEIKEEPKQESAAGLASLFG